MKKFKAYFKMVITAVICLAMSLVPGKKKGQAVDALTGGQAFGGKGNAAFGYGKTAVGNVTEIASAQTRKMASADSRKNAADMQHFRSSTLQRHVFVPTVGPGDRSTVVYPVVKESPVVTEEKKVIIFPAGLWEEDVFIREIRICRPEALLKEDSG